MLLFLGFPSLAGYLFRRLGEGAGRHWYESTSLAGLADVSPAPRPRFQRPATAGSAEHR